MVKKLARKYVTTKVSKGRTYYYFRRGETYERLPSDPGSLEFDEAWLCLESGGNSLAAFSEHVDLGLIRPRGQV